MEGPSDLPFNRYGIDPYGGARWRASSRGSASSPVVIDSAAFRDATAFVPEHDEQDAIRDSVAGASQGV